MKYSGLGAYNCAHYAFCVAAEQTNGYVAQQTSTEAKNAPKGEDMSAANFAFRGRLAPESFSAFARGRAARLSLTLEEGEGCSQSYACLVRGPLALVDAFEMACSLGPMDCLVLEVWREDQS